MYLNHTYLWTFNQGDYKLEVYDTGKRKLFSRDLVLAYQVFFQGRLLMEDENLIVPRKALSKVSVTSQIARRLSDTPHIEALPTAYHCLTL